MTAARRHRAGRELPELEAAGRSPAAAASVPEIEGKRRHWRLNLTGLFKSDAPGTGPSGLNDRSTTARPAEVDASELFL
ncbi:MAG TPA: hypothetical protein VHK26_03815 [Methyloceanibacter sp.]|nr:hypothetical protein [Methyloceanibacter sp.]